jgi:hypothetical protein
VRRTQKEARARAALIRERAASGESLSELAKEFGFTYGHAWCIATGRRLARAGGPIRVVVPRAAQ